MTGSWDFGTWALALGVVAWAAAQYGLAWWTLRDLVRRPHVRGGNKVAWALLILTLPLVGALLYASVGPTSFLPRGAGPAGSGRRAKSPPAPAAPG